MDKNEGKEPVMVEYLIIAAIVLALAALVFSDSKKTVVLTWLVSLVVSIKYLTNGLDTVGLGLILEASLLCGVLLNVTQAAQVKIQENKKAKWVLGALLTLMTAGAVFGAAFYQGKTTDSDVLLKNDFTELARQLLSENFLATELLLLLGFIVLVGLGLNLRREAKK